MVADAFDVNAAIQGFGRHSKFLSMEQEIQANKYAQLAVIVAIWAKCAIKLSICCFLLNIIKGTHRKVMLAIKILMGLTILTSFISAVLWGLQARPIEALWDMRIPGHRESPEQFIDTLYVIYCVYSSQSLILIWMRGATLTINLQLSEYSQICYTLSLPYTSSGTSESR